MNAASGEQSSHRSCCFQILGLLSRVVDVVYIDPPKRLGYPQTVSMDTLLVSRPSIRSEVDST